MQLDANPYTVDINAKNRRTVCKSIICIIHKLLVFKNLRTIFGYLIDCCIMCVYIHFFCLDSKPLYIYLRF